MVRGGSAAKRDRLLRPRARLARVGGYAVSLDAAHGLATTPVGVRRVPRYRDDTAGGCSTRRPGRIDARARARATRDRRPTRAATALPARRPSACASTSTLGPAPETTAAWPARAQPVEQRQRLGHRPGPLALVQPVLGRLEQQRRVAASGRAPAARPRAALSAASACGTGRAAARGRRRWTARVRHEQHRRDAGVDASRTARGAPSGRPGSVSAAEQAGGHVVRVALQLGGQRAARRRRRAARAVRAQRPGGQHAGDDRPRPTSPARGPAGCCWRSAARSPGGGQPSRSKAARMARTTRCARRAGSSPAPSPATSTASPRRRDLRLDVVVAGQRQPERSRTPGPRLALVAGTRTRTGAAGTSAAIGGPQARGCAGGRGGVHRDRRRRRRAGDRPLRVLEAVAGDRADHAWPRLELAGRVRPAAARPRSRRDAGSTNTPSCGPAAGRRRGSARSVTASMRPPDSSRAASALRPGRRVADPDRGGDRLRLRDDRRAVTIGAAPAAWKPNIRGVARRDAVGGVLAVALPVGGDVAGVADRQAVDVGGVAERVARSRTRRSSGPRCGPG